ncbi:MAG TPA: asparaginase [Pyrinomonadaceae bacterium]|jgi:L-asparaginase II|nr:asparaginase [Pyrinomonadaceae bacterium]
MIKRGQNTDTQQPAALVEVRRGPIVESRHRGHIVAVEGDGKIVAHLGVPESVSYLRSSAKPHQAIPLVASGAADRFGFTPQEIAIACGSHNGELAHVETVAGMLRKIGLGADALKCGTHEPFGREVARDLRERGERPNVLQNNCSGKHTGMLALTLHLSASTETYDDPTNPVQLTIAHTIAQFSDTPVDEIAIGVDGCGVPVFGISIHAMAFMYARLMSPPAGMDDESRAACERIVAAMTSHPEMVGGARERFDTEMMRAARVVSKVGAEGIYTAGIAPCEEWPRGLGVAFKIEDGEDRRARPTVAIETLRQLRVLNENALEKLATYAAFPIHNHRGDIVGEVRPAFDLIFN